MGILTDAGHEVVIGVFDDKPLAMLAAAGTEQAYVAPIELNTVRDIRKPWPGLVIPYRSEPGPGMVAGAR